MTEYCDQYHKLSASFPRTFDYRFTPLSTKKNTLNMSWINDVNAMFSHKCAECHEGDMFPTGAFSFNKPFEMNERCPLCDANMEPEPGFYYGAMFMSYIFSAFISLGLVMLTHWVMDFTLTQSFFILITIVAIFFVWWFRFSRAFWFNLIIGFKPEKAKLANTHK